MIKFLNPEIFIVCFFIALLVAVSLFFAKKSKNTIFSQEVFQKLSFENKSFFNTKKRVAVLFLALFFMALSLARPVIDRGEKEIVSKGTEIVIGLDISLSMDAKDIYPTRLQASLNKIKKLIDESRNDKIAIVAFAENSYIISPMTNDKKIINYLIDSLDISRFENRSSNVLAVIEATKMLSQQENKVLLVLSDGDEGELKELKDEALKNNITIYGLGMADKKGAPISDGQGGYVKDKNGNIVISGLNPDFEKIALASGGAYVDYRVSNDDILALYKQIKTDADDKEFEKEKIRDYIELFYFPLGVALVMMILAFHSLPSRLLAVLVLFLIPNDAFSASFDFKEMKEAKEHYKANRFDEAIKSYEAIDGLDGEALARKFYNIGNAHYKLQDYQKAVENYEKSLELKDDEDAKHNLELAKKELKKQEEKKEKNSKDDKEDKKEEKQKKSDDSQKKESKKQENDKGEKESSEDIKQSKNEREEISDEEEKKWLKELDKNPNPMPLKNIPTPKGEKNGKNW
ncbi:MAG: Ca-activated chloride channel [Campylobacterota bacterium]|nr:Ca-activated chloride channel [Campylobacterota bacterium]